MRAWIGVLSAAVNTLPRLRFRRGLVCGSRGIWLADAASDLRETRVQTASVGRFAPVRVLFLSAKHLFFSAKAWAVACASAVRWRAP
jgi:hypothetical protein